MATATGASHPAIGGATGLQFLSILDWLTHDLIAADPSTADAKTSGDPAKKKDKATPQDSQGVLAIELPKVAAPVKPSIVLDQVAVTGSTDSTEKTSPAPPEPELEAASTRAELAFVAVLTEHTPTPKEAIALPKAGAILQAPRENGASVLKEVAPLKAIAPLRNEPASNVQDFSSHSDPEHNKEAAPSKQPDIPHLIESQFHASTSGELIAIKPEQSPSPAPAKAEHAEGPKAELKTEINTTARPQPTREIALKLTGAEAGSVDLRISERAGKVQVDVRTPDGELARSLRADLGDLVGRLEKRGFDAQTWTPNSQSATAVGSPDRADTNSDQASQQFPGGGGQHAPSQGQDGRQKKNQRLEFMRQFETSVSFAEGIKENHVNIPN